LNLEKELMTGAQYQPAPRLDPPVAQQRPIQGNTTERRHEIRNGLNISCGCSIMGHRSAQRADSEAPTVCSGGFFSLS
jgi:hypothetical protein